MCQLDTMDQPSACWVWWRSVPFRVRSVQPVPAESTGSGWSLACDGHPSDTEEPQTLPSALSPDNQKNQPTIITCQQENESTNSSFNKQKNSQTILYLPTGNQSIIYSLTPNKFKLIKSNQQVTQRRNWKSVTDWNQCSKWVTEN